MQEEVKRRPNEFVIRLAPGRYAYLKYSMSGNALHIDATFTPEEYRGRGLAEKLMEAAIAYAQQNALKIVPNCSYAKSYFEKHHEHRDLLANI